jgi:rare lipoprotein A
MAPAAIACEASWYGFESGRTTASGERFDPAHALTAAHPSLPLGTIIHVQAFAHGRPLGPKIAVRVNDRGPAKWTGRCLDVSKAAARALGFEKAGKASVTIER